MNSEFGMRNSELYVDNTAHRLYYHGHDFPCDRDVEATAIWGENALLLSSDTDCLSLWDEEGLVRTARVGVYPQDMALRGDTAYVCGGADGQIHLLGLPELHPLGSIAVPGMPERICIFDSVACVLTLLADMSVCTALMLLDCTTGACTEQARYPGLPGAVAADAGGIWLGISECVLHLPWGSSEPDTVFEGFGLPRRIHLQDGAALVEDPLEKTIVRLTRSPRPGVMVLRHGGKA